jgi:AmiR/NasT family two-component response regulator
VNLSDQLRQALVSRESIDLARGIIIGATGCTADEAFQRLVEESQHTNTKLRDLATEMVRRATRRAGGIG